MSFYQYKEEYLRSITDTDRYWGDKARSLIEWDQDFSKVYNNKFESSEWFKGGKLNACYNCIDRHVKTSPDKVAIVYIDNDNNITKYTYKECLEYICKISQVLLDNGLKKGDCVSIFMPSCPEALFSILGCTRLGVVYNSIFGGFSFNSLLHRVKDSNTKYLITSDSANIAGSLINFWETVDKVLESQNINCLLFDFRSKPVKEGFEITYWSSVLKEKSRFIQPVSMNSEDILFYMYTSGSTGKPKGIIHTTGGFLVYAATTSKECFDLKPGDVFSSTSNMGWISGQTYSLYGPLLNGCTTVIIGGDPLYPDFYRLFSIIEKCKITQLYTAPTVIRTLKKFFSTNKFEKKFDLSSLRLLGSVGEPINKEAYNWFKEAFNNLHIVDTYWQTETGGIMIAPIPNTVIGKPECASIPFYGVEVGIIRPDPDLKNLVEANNNELGHVVFKKSWPGICRGILNDQGRYLSAYFSYKGCFFTGDEGFRDSDGMIWICGRSDDIIKVSGQKLSTAELESAACTDEYVAEAAVVDVHDEIAGLGLVVFIVLKNSEFKESPCEANEKFKENIRKINDNINKVNINIKNYEDKAIESLKKTLKSKIGNFIRPKKIIICQELPKTFSGKIMRRVLRDILTGSLLEDLSTCINKTSIEAIMNSAKLNTFD